MLADARDVKPNTTISNVEVMGSSLLIMQNEITQLMESNTVSAKQSAKHIDTAATNFDIMAKRMRALKMDAIATEKIISEKTNDPAKRNRDNLGYKG